MKKIAFVTRKMVTGGIEKSLIALLEKMSPMDYEVTVFVMAEGGELYNEIPSWVKIVNVYECRVSKKKEGIAAIKRFDVVSLYRLLKNSFKERRLKRVYDVETAHLKDMDVRKEEFDIAVAYHVPCSFTVRYVVEKLKSRMKLAWVHSDISVYLEEFKLYKQYYDEMDAIYCVSKYAVSKFEELLPDVKTPVKLYYNHINSSEIIKLANEPMMIPMSREEFNITTVGRVTFQKGFDIIPTIVKTLKDLGVHVRWYCIGDGGELDNVKQLTADLGLEKIIIFAGQQSNPYPYIRGCDIYVQPSRHEGYCITLAEARVLSKPIISTDFVGAREQLIDGESGIITKFDTNEISSAISNLFYDSNLAKHLSSNVDTSDLMDDKQFDSVFGNNQNRAKVK